MPSDSGFQIVPGVITEHECTEIAAYLAGLPARSRAGARHLMGHRRFSELAHDPRLVSLASHVLGHHALPYRVTLFDKSASSNWLVVWHQDAALPLRTRFSALGWGPWSIKAGVLYAHAPASALEHIAAVRVHLDASPPENGPLRIVPGSHLLGVLTDDQIRELVRSHGSTECHVAIGGALVMRPLHVHSSSKVRGAAPRRVLHVEYSDSFNLGGQVHLAAA